MALGQSEKKDVFQSIISGIGKKYECRLYAAGILTYEQLASTSLSTLYELVKDVPMMTMERLEEKDWPAQARAKVTEHLQTASQKKTLPFANHQHYATFKVQLLLDADNTVRRTDLECIQDEAQAKWAGWDERRMLAFIIQHADLKLPVTEIPAASEGLKAPAVPEQIEASVESAPTDAGGAELAEGFCLSDLTVLPSGSLDDRRGIWYDQPFRVRLTVDVPDAAVPGDRPLEYTADVRGRKLVDRSRQDIARKQGTVMQGGLLEIDMPGAQVSRGMYRLDAHITLSSAALNLQTSLKDGGLLHVY